MTGNGCQMKISDMHCTLWLWRYEYMYATKRIPSALGPHFQVYAWWHWRFTGIAQFDIKGEVSKSASPRVLLKKPATHVHGLSGDQSLQLVIFTTNRLGTQSSVAKLARAWLFWQGLFLYISFCFKCLMIVRHFIQNDLWDLTRLCGTLNVRCYRSYKIGFVPKRVKTKPV